MSNSVLYENIRKRRRELNMTQGELAALTGYTDRTSISKIENGAVDLSETKIVSFANALRTTPTALLGWEAPPAPPAGFDPVPNTRSIPLVGTIACGTPILAEENIECMVDLPCYIRADFALRCRGDSMILAGIRNNDIVYIRRQPVVENGQIAAVLIGEEATLKRFYRYENTVRLVAENPSVPPITCIGDEINSLRIEGVAVGYTHLMEY